MKRLFALLTPVIILSLILSSVACGNEAETPTPTPQTTQTPVVTATPRATQTASTTTAVGQTATPVPTTALVVTATPRPASTPTAAPQATPTPAAKPIVLKLTNGNQETDRRGPQIKKFKELVEKYTGGRVTIELYLGGVLFPPKAEWEAVSTGAIDLAFTPPFFASTVIPQGYVFYLFPGIWEGYEHGEAVIKDGRVAKMLGDLAWAKGVKQLGLYPYSVAAAVISRRREIKVIPDMKDTKMGNAGVPPAIWTVYAGAKVVTVSQEELFLAMSQGIVDTWAGAPAVAVANKIWEVADYAFFYPSGYSVTLMWMNKNRWNSLAPDIQDIIENKVVPEAVEFSVGMAKEFDDKDTKSITAKVKAAHWVTPEDLNAARAALKDDPTFKKQVDSVGPEILKIIDDLKPSKKA